MKCSHGGHRPNAGRKPEGDTNKIKVTVFLDSNLKQKISAIAEEKNQSLSKTINQILKEWNNGSQ